MELQKFYQNRAEQFARYEQICKKKRNWYSLARLFLFLSIVVLGLGCYMIIWWLGILVAFILMVIFAVLCIKDLKNSEKQQEFERLIQINSSEAKCVVGDFSTYPTGNQYKDSSHYYESDLDIFGTHSLFAYLNRTSSPSGSNMLAQWLSQAAPTEEIMKRQVAVKELSEQLELRQKMQAIGIKNKNVYGDLPYFLQWLKGKATLLKKKKILKVIKVLPWFTFSAIIISCLGWISSSIPWLFISIHFSISYLTSKTVALLHQQTSRKVSFISTYLELINIFSYTHFTSPYLIELRKKFIDSDAVRQIDLLKKCNQKLDYRLNSFYYPANLLFFFDYKHLVWLEKWRLKNHRKVEKWFEAIAQVEALLCFANLHYNNPNWVMPTINNEYFHIDAQKIGHPLIPEKERVCSDFKIRGTGCVAIITGSNMSGKSTFQRSIGVNFILALAGAPVCASLFTISSCQLYTYMRITDSLEEQTSSFYAELKRLKRLIDLSKEGSKVFFLLDEILRGTNSRDRQIGSMALIRQLVRNNISGIIATHDLGLSELQSEMPQNIQNSHFDVQIKGEEMFFDYKLHPGVCRSLNASILMKKIGIEINKSNIILSEANEAKIDNSSML